MTRTVILTVALITFAFSAVAGATAHPAMATGPDQVLQNAVALSAPDDPPPPEKEDPKNPPPPKKGHKNPPPPPEKKDPKNPPPPEQKDPKNPPPPDPAPGN